ncbi:MAG: acetylornithine transaminase, partial [Albimonas sp.]|uniref:acetylornithine transaminase n=1 Tax=Albimonas sp. TaxID=1872425 RepID=UPI00405786C2
SATGNPKYLEGFGPPAPGYRTVAFRNTNELRAAIDDETAALLVEPIQGEGGIRPAELDYLRELRRICEEFGLLLIFDEIQCGMGRTGKLFAYEWADTPPDIMMLAKGIGGGFPLGACLATESAADGMGFGTHGSTYGGNPLGCAVGCAVMEAVLEDGFLAEVSRKAGAFRQKLEGLIAAHPDVYEGVRGEGLMLGLKCKAPNTDVVAAGYDAHLLVVPAADNVVRLLPPLNITDEEMAEAVARLDAAALAVEAKLKEATG